MAIIVKHRRTGNEYIVLGISGEGGKASLPSRFLNDLFTPEQQENSSVLTICDARGNIFSSYMHELVVIEIDGKKPAEILPEPVISAINDRFENDNFDDDKGWQQENGEAELPTENSDVENKSNERADKFDDDEDWI